MKTHSKSWKHIIAFLLVTVFVFTLTNPVFAANTKVSLVTEKSGTEYKYNSKGLLIKKISGDAATEYKYNSDNTIKSATIKSSGQVIWKVTYTYNSKKQLTKRVTQNVKTKQKATEKFVYKNGVPSKWTWILPDETKNVYKLVYNKKGLLTKKSLSENEKEAAWYTKYEYNSEGYMIGLQQDNNASSKRKLTYKNGVMTKYRETLYSGDTVLYSSTVKLKRKSVSVSKKMEDLVNVQQREIINGNDPLYFGDLSWAVI